MKCDKDEFSTEYFQQKGYVHPVINSLLTFTEQLLCAYHVPHSYQHYFWSLIKKPTIIPFIPAKATKIILVVYNLAGWEVTPRSLFTGTSNPFETGFEK